MGISIRVAVVAPNVAMPSEEMKQRGKHLIQVCRPEASIHACNNEVGLAAIESQGSTKKLRWK
jgi:hypothetical protein